MNFKKIILSMLLTITLGPSLLAAAQNTEYNFGDQADNEYENPAPKHLIEHEDIIQILLQAGLNLEEEWHSCIDTLTFDEQIALLDEEDSIAVFQEETIKGELLQPEFLVIDENEPKQASSELKSDCLFDQSKQFEVKKHFPKKFIEKLKELREKVGRTFDLLKNKLCRKLVGHEDSVADFLKKLGLNLNQNITYSDKYYKFSAKRESTLVGFVDAIKIVILRYFSETALNTRLSDCDKFIYDLPRLSVFIKITPKYVKIYGYPSARQDMLYPVV